MIDVLTVGDLMLDVRVEASELVPGGDVPGRVRVRPAGTSANSAVWAASVGARSAVVGRVGDDLAGQLIAGALEEAGVLALLTVDAGAETGTMLVVTDERDRSMVQDRGANGRLSPSDLPDELHAHAILVSGYMALDPATEQVARAAISRARAPQIAVDAASWPLIGSRGPEAFFAATAGATLLFANAAEAEALSGVDAEDAAEALSSRYPAVAVKLGEHGAILWWEGLLVRYEGVAVREVDPTGAGDAFDGVFLASLAAGGSPADALHAACAAGARVVASTEAWPERS